MHVRRDHKVLEFFLKYASKSKVITQRNVIDWYFKGGSDGPILMITMLKTFVKEGIIEVKCVDCFIRKVVDACCKGVRY